MSWESLLVQVPLCVAVIWFVLEMDKRNARYAERRDNEWRKFLEEQRQAFTDSLKNINRSVNNLRNEFRCHDQMTKELTVRMETKTAVTKGE